MSSREDYLYLGEREIGAVNNDGSCTQLRIFGIENKGDIGSTVAMELRGKMYVPLHDYRGNVSCLIDAENHEVAESYRYSTFGEETQNHQSLSPWRFSSKRFDPETGWIYLAGGTTILKLDSGRLQTRWSLRTVPTSIVTYKTAQVDSSIPMECS